MPPEYLSPLDSQVVKLAKLAQFPENRGHCKPEYVTDERAGVGGVGAHTRTPRLPHMRLGQEQRRQGHMQRVGDHLLH